MKLTFETYILPEIFACALINEDFSGLELCDMDALQNWIAEKQEENPDHYFICSGCSEEPFFSWKNDISRYGADCLEFTFNTSKI